MDEHDPKGYGSEKAFDMLPTSKKGGTLRDRAWVLVAVLWVFVSAYPTWLYWAREAHLVIPSRPQATVTQTVAVPAVGKTALPNAVPNSGFNPRRINDATDTFRSYKSTSDCGMSSLDLHGPFEPLCEDKNSLLQAMSSGGRIGFDAPFSPRGCDMRWFSTEEVCKILSKFEKVFVLGDNMMRNVAVASHIYLRADFVNGARTIWLDDPRGVDCSCAGPFSTHKCALHSVASTSTLFQNSPGSVLCPRASIGGIEYFGLLEYPIQQQDLKDFLKHLPQERPSKPYAFVMGHGLWNDLVKEKTFAWLDQLIEEIQEQAPYLARRDAFFPRLFLTPHAAGPNKPYIFHARQGNLAIQTFETQVAPFVQSRGVDHLGTFNATVQAENPDGTHGSLKTNLLKAMMVMNWLNAIEVPYNYDGRAKPPSSEEEEGEVS